MLDWIEQAVLWAEKNGGPDYQATQPRLEVVTDDYGEETDQARVYYRGPLRWGGSPRAIRVDVTHNKNVVSSCVTFHVIHPYSDEAMLGRTQVLRYTLIEIMAAKIRAVGGQRRFAVSRDLYDIRQLVQSGLDVDDVIPLLPAKSRPSISCSLLYSTVLRDCPVQLGSAFSREGILIGIDSHPVPAE